MDSPEQESDIELARELVEKDKIEQKVLELPIVVESDTLEGRIEGKYRSIQTKVENLPISFFLPFKSDSKV